MAVRVTVTMKGAGFDVPLRNARELADKELSAGVLRTAGKASDQKTDLVDVAIWNEFGTSRIPARPFMRNAAEKNGKEWEKLVAKVADRVIDGSMGAGQGMEIVGNQVVSDIQQVIGNRSLLAPNAPATVRRKGSDAPLIDTGNLRQSISFEVR